MTEYPIIVNVMAIQLSFFTLFHAAIIDLMTFVSSLSVGRKSTGLNPAEVSG